MTDCYDLVEYPEDRRIQIIGYYAVTQGKLTSFAVEDHQKADRYITKLKKEFPTIKIHGRKRISQDIVLVVIGPPEEVKL